jgi:hypothetical protein
MVVLAAFCVAADIALRCCVAVSVVRLFSVSTSVVVSSSLTVRYYWHSDLCECESNLGQLDQFRGH